MYSRDSTPRVVDDDGGNYCDVGANWEVHPLSLYTGWTGGGASSRWRCFTDITRDAILNDAPSSSLVPNCYLDSGKLGEESMRDGSRQG